jgi:hypothetical protein
MPSNHTLHTSRNHAYQRQNGRCHYCEAPMWRRHPSEISTLDLKPGSARLLQCTAEHLKPRKDGGSAGAENIVAACWWCNSRRHRRRAEFGEARYRAWVRQRVGRGAWWPARIGAAIRRALSPLELE